ncbi:MAG TPA: DNA-directed RNA polymerase subunit omega [Anaerolineae bacterium]|jgi:DNA-directed RNA polymerase subunit omega|nr:DNA-directed RNA polymerase subunit omega [Anaerolineae bacterium]
MARPDISKLLGKFDSKYTLVIAAAKRARQINDYFNAIRRHDLVRVRPPQIEAVSGKPLSIALEEILQEKLEYERLVEGIK